MITQYRHWSDPSSADIERPNAARIYDYLLDGAANFAVDRKIAQRLIDLDPRMPQYAQANRYFLQWAVEEIADAGVFQFLDIGPGVSTVGCVHETAQAINRRARTVYVDVDPVAVLLWEKLLVDDPLSTVVRGDVRDIDAVLADPGVHNLIDPGQPIAVLASEVLHFVPDNDDLARIVKDISAALMPGSYLGISHATPPATPDDAWTSALLAAFEETTTPLTLRRKAEITILFDGWELVRPVGGLGEWLEPQIPVPGAAGLGRLP